MRNRVLRLYARDPLPVAKTALRITKVARPTLGMPDTTGGPDSPESTGQSLEEMAYDLSRMAAEVATRDSRRRAARNSAPVPWHNTARPHNGIDSPPIEPPNRAQRVALPMPGDFKWYVLDTTVENHPPGSGPLNRSPDYVSIEARPSLDGRGGTEFLVSRLRRVYEYLDAPGEYMHMFTIDQPRNILFQGYWYIALVDQNVPEVFPTTADNPHTIWVRDSRAGERGVLFNYTI